MKTINYKNNIFTKKEALEVLLESKKVTIVDFTLLFILDIKAT